MLLGAVMTGLPQQMFEVFRPIGVLLAYSFWLLVLARAPIVEKAERWIERSGLGRCSNWLPQDFRTATSRGWRWVALVITIGIYVSLVLAPWGL